MGVEWIDRPREPGYRVPEGGMRAPYEDAYQESQRQKVADENCLAALLAGGLGVAAILGLRWIIKRRDAATAAPASPARPARR
jgi:uncharacterized protein YgbK (DUF1537 family)